MKRDVPASTMAPPAALPPFPPRPPLPPRVVPSTPGEPSPPLPPMAPLVTNWQLRTIKLPKLKIAPPITDCPGVPLAPLPPITGLLLGELAEADKPSAPMTTLLEKTQLDTVKMLLESTRIAPATFVLAPFASVILARVKLLPLVTPKMGLALPPL